MDVHRENDGYKFSSTNIYAVLLMASKISNNDLWTKNDQEPVVKQIKRRKWSWLGHTLGRNDDRIAKQALK